MSLGLLRNVNSFIEKYSESAFIELDGKASNLNILLNCIEESINHVRENPIDSSLFEVAVGDNILSLLYPGDFKLELQKVFKDVTQERPDLKEKLQQFGILNLEA